MRICLSQNQINQYSPFHTTYIHIYNSFYYLKSRKIKNKIKGKLGTYPRVYHYHIHLFLSCQMDSIDQKSFMVGLESVQVG